MRVFVTGATGFIGSAIVRELLGAGHEVVGLARSAPAAHALLAAGADVLCGDIEDRDCLRRGAERADGVVHAACPRGTLSGPAAAAIERTAIRALGAALAGSSRPLLVTSTIAALRPAGLAREDNRPRTGHDHPHAASEQAADALAACGVRVTVVRLPPVVYGADEGGLVPALSRLARKTGLVGYLAQGHQGWAAVHQLDAARLYRLALEQPLPPGTRLHAVAEAGVSIHRVAAAIGRQLALPVVSIAAEATAAHFGPLAALVGLDMRATSWLTRRLLPWQPQQAGLLTHFNHNC